MGGVKASYGRNVLVFSVGRQSVKESNRCLLSPRSHICRYEQRRYYRKLVLLDASRPILLLWPYYASFSVGGGQPAFSSCDPYAYVRVVDLLPRLPTNGNPYGSSLERCNFFRHDRSTASSCVRRLCPGLCRRYTL